MKNRLTWTLSIALLGAGIALQGCNKETLTEITPKTVQATQAEATTPPTKMQAAWQRFVDRVERGEQVDPSGQYVAKSTKMPLNEGGQATLRPKFDAAKPEFAKHYAMLVNGEIAGLANGQPVPDYSPPICEDCDGGGGGTTITSTFTSSIGKGGTGSILDVKIVFNNPSPSSTDLYNAGYIMLNADLNKGAGGDYIYFTFSRDPLRGLMQNEPNRYEPYGDVYSIVRNFQTKNGGRSNIPSPNTDFFNIWSINEGGWARVDLNSGAGGEYIYSYQTKNPTYSNNAQVTEIGVLSGNSDTIQPPAGWVKYSADLNEGSGGDYIYLCYKY